MVVFIYMATQRQKQAIANLKETKGNVSRAMRMAGYSKSVANQPTVLTKSKAYQEMERLMPELGITVENYLKPIAKGLKAKTILRDNNGKKIGSVDNLDLQIKASDRAEKLLFRNNTPATSNSNDSTDNTNSSNNIAPELLEAIRNGDIKELQRIIFKDDSSVSSVIDADKDDTEHGSK